jgi:hypothetical protein
MNWQYLFALFCCNLCTVLSFFVKHIRIYSRFFEKNQIITYNLENSDDYWIERDEEVIIKLNSEVQYQNGLSLFDSVYNSMEDDNYSQHSVSMLSLHEISDIYHFSLNYLGDFVAQMGCSCPIDVDTSISNLLNGEQIYTLLEALTSLDPYEINIEYDSVTIRELADDLGISIKTIVNICEKQSYHLPFGLNTLLHSSAINQIKIIQEYDEEYNNDIYNTNKGNEEDTNDYY